VRHGQGDTRAVEGAQLRHDKPVPGGQVIASATASGLTLDRVHAEPSSFCRPGSTCQDVVLRFHDPDDGHHAGRVCRFTVYFSDVLPVTIGELHS
jgi:hypothetical protein